ncbi:multicopper oxidase-domain-containing protein [Mariannaea sp. PMI_226]|nr:multicopper oxidase-domain-containing protein [Mariannaea sp. PMI_226]
MVWALPEPELKHKNIDRHDKEYDFTVTWEDNAPDGVKRKMLMVNKQMPGPEIRVSQDDWVVVNVRNYSPQNITIHFHGIEMMKTPWSDGVPGVSQQGIKPGGSFRYKWKATQYGSFWYHAHFHGQIEDGLYGAIIIRPRSSHPDPFHLISKDRHELLAMKKAETNVHPLLIGDHTHLTSDQKWDMTQKANFEDSCYDSILFNGKGSVDCLPANVLAANLGDQQKTFLGMFPGSKMTDKGCIPAEVMSALGGGKGNFNALLPGTFTGCKASKGHTEVIKPNHGEDKWMAIDFIGAINFMTGVVSIDEHDMWVYAMDGSYIQPQKVQGIVLSNGERYSVLVKVNKKGNFKIRFSSVAVPQIIAGNAILSIDGARDLSSNSKPWVTIAGVPTSKNVAFFDLTKAAPYPADPIAKKADSLFKLNMMIKGSSYLWALNETQLKPVDLESRYPVLFHPKFNAHDNVTISTKHNTWVDLVMVSATFPQPPHPIHKHGNKMYQIGSGNGDFKWNSVDEAIKEIPHQFNLVNPPRRDVFTTPPAFTGVAWTVLRYHVINPGAWLLHCHINNHMMGGMMMVIQDGVDKWPKIPAEYQNGGNGVPHHYGY